MKIGRQGDVEHEFTGKSISGGIILRNEEFICGKKCFVYENGSSSNILIQPIAKHDLENLDEEVEKIGELSDNKNFTLYAILTCDWNRELSPWKAPAVFGSEDFKGGAEATLKYIEQDLLPYIQDKCAGQKVLKCYLGGYSLAGLFALWAAYRTDVFAGIAAASPSVWFPGWTDFIERQSIKSRFVYMSIGDKEEKTKNPVMAKVGENIRYTEKVLKESGQSTCCILEYNKGNHFKDCCGRMAKAFAWSLNYFADLKQHSKIFS